MAQKWLVAVTRLQGALVADEDVKKSNKQTCSKRVPNCMQYVTGTRHVQLQLLCNVPRGVKKVTIVGNGLSGIPSAFRELSVT